MIAIFRWLRTILAVVALGVSAYLLWLSDDHAIGPAICGDSELADCDEVLDSRWSHWLNVPVSLPAVAVYMTLAVVPWFEDRPFSPKWRSAAVTVSVTLTTVAAGAAIWFAGIQLVKLHKICPFCMTVHLCGLTIAGLVAASLLISRRSEVSGEVGAERARRLLRGGVAGPSMARAGRGRWPGGGRVAGAAGAGAALLALFIAVQLLVVPATMVVQRIAPVGPAKLARSPARSADRPPADRDATRFEHAALTRARSESSNGEQGGHAANGDNAPAGQRRDATVPESTPVDLLEQTSAASQRRGHPPHAGPPATADPRSGDGPVASRGRDVGERKVVGEGKVAGGGKVAGEGPVAGDGQAAGAEEAADPASAGAVRPAAMRLKLLGGKVDIALADQMVLGNPDAPYRFAELFDYSCPHCRRMHGLLKQVRKRYGDSLAIVLLPVPLNAGCNRFVAQTYGRHVYACLYPRLALQVWNGNRPAFEDFHNWLMEGDEPPAPGRARDRADRLCREGGGGRRLSEQWIDRHIEACVDIYGACESRGLPRLLFQGAITSGAASDIDALSATLDEQLGIRQAKEATGPAEGASHAGGRAKP